MATSNTTSEDDIVKAYQDLVTKRKSCHLCNELKNPSDHALIQFDSDHIGPWSCWQGNINSKLVVVGQDWGDTTYFLKWKGLDQPQNNPTNENLQKLLTIIGINVKKPRETQDQIAFFTNMILCLKTGGLQASIDDEWLRNCSVNFFKPLMDIIKPQIIISLGKKVSESILDLYNISFPKNKNFSFFLRHSPIRLASTTVFFLYIIVVLVV